jgi:hypothetical protein
LALQEDLLPTPRSRSCTDQQHVQHQRANPRRQTRHGRHQQGHCCGEIDRQQPQGAEAEYDRQPDQVHQLPQHGIHQRRQHRPQHFAAEDRQVAGGRGQRSQCPRCVQRQDLPTAHDRHVVCQALRFIQIMRAQHDAAPGVLHVQHELPHGARRQRVESGCRLVEEQHLRLVQQRAGERHLLLHAAREGHHAVVPPGV